MLLHLAGKLNIPLCLGTKLCVSFKHNSLKICSAAEMGTS